MAVAAAVPDQREALRAVGIADLSHLGKLEVRPGARRRAGAGRT